MLSGMWVRVVYLTNSEKKSKPCRSFYYTKNNILKNYSSEGSLVGLFIKENINIFESNPLSFRRFSVFLVL